ncbi:CGNR zinc finger domain-containing protein [Oharaeibacter diazotrophicus]|uniref:Putative RNA-binding Zn ribbon-like protein n=1 Tax=Oharaeibacter diazotrophicus TaxID=1920512 RepID=A0A4R6RLA9_9HYPH|nr:CGNR zinc finger domain-containing protein [Oharaeibacter diazotrophicus]TDP87272.1 putative RNA-binding Zn ribbon-like protein [Oharaeibacter diazotrophicus]BBE70784.1 CGNR zinc finger [Pleomorphomonas sp. SM30]GLS77533.1 hypothetical protein GCM10007904_28700 [Oharaeibacter diazotrophicus]
MSDEFRDGMPFVGSRLWLDFLNTTPLDPDGRPVDLVADADGLGRWTDAAGLAGEVSAGEDPHEAGRFREILRGAFERLVRGEAIGDDVVAEVDRRLAGVAHRLRLTVGADGPQLAVERRAAGVTGVVAEDFARFVCDHEPARLKHCANPACSMVFYDVGKNARRRWCTMSVCGNRDKVGRFRDRKRREAGTA